MEVPLILWLIILTINAGDPHGRHVVIVDDLVQTGGTLLQSAKVLYPKILHHYHYRYYVQALIEAGASKISMYVTHAVFPRGTWKPFTESPDGIKIETFWITDSIPHALEIAEVRPFKLISICEVIADSLLGYDLLTCNQ